MSNHPIIISLFLCCFWMTFSLATTTGYSIPQIKCQDTLKIDRKLEYLPELEELGPQMYCQVVLSNCNVVFEKSKFERLSLYAFTRCENVEFEFGLKDSYSGDIYKAIVPSIDWEGGYVISFVSQRRFQEKQKTLINSVLNHDEVQHNKFVDQTYRKVLRNVVL